MSLPDRELTDDREYQFFCQKIHALTDLDLGSYKRNQMDRRLRSLMERLGVSGYVEYAQLLERDAQLGAVLHRRKDVLVDRHPLAGGARVVADRGLVLGDDRGVDVGVASQAERLRGLGAEEQLGELAATVGGQPTADPLPGDELHLRSPFAHLHERRLVGVEETMWI
jgi:hypothetical protein